MVPDEFDSICMVWPIKLSRSLTPSIPYELSFFLTPPWPLSLMVITLDVNWIVIDELFA